MSKKDIAEFETQLTKLCELWRPTITHAELVGVLDTVKMGYHIRTIQNFEATEMSETPVIKGEQATAPAETGSPTPEEING